MLLPVEEVPSIINSSTPQMITPLLSATAAALGAWSSKITGVIVEVD